MPKKKPADPNKKPQHERFKEAAREIGADESSAKFEEVFGKIVPAKNGRQPKASGSAHASDCAIYNAPAIAPGPCDCGAER